MQDRELIELIKTDREAGTEQLLRQYSGFVYTIVYSKISSAGTKEDAEECAADVFVELCRNLSSFDLSKGSLKAFLSIIAKRVAIARFHMLTKNKPELISTDDDDSPVNELCSAENDRESQRLLLDAIESLGKPDSTIIMRKYFIGETAKQIGAALGMNGFTVDKRIRRALVKLGKVLKEAGYNE